MTSHHYCIHFHYTDCAGGAVIVGKNGARRTFSSSVACTSAFC